MVLSVILLICSQLLLLQTHTPSALPFNQGGKSTLNHVTDVEGSSALGRPHLKIFHPTTSSCVMRKSLKDPLILAPCKECESWQYTPQKLLTLTGTYFCLQAVGSALPARLSIECSGSDFQWFQESETEATHLWARLQDGTVVCLDVDDDNTIITNPCTSSSIDAKATEDDSQWFEIATISYNEA